MPFALVNAAADVAGDLPTGGEKGLGGIGGRKLLAGGERCWGMVGWFKHNAWATYSGNWYLCCDGDWKKHSKKNSKKKCPK